ncbi:hypothetical protein [Asaccharospora irregularis]|uniref:Transmembrane protein n=1 Tax=Asaccharospora irregularis DSM 2635 TaxID=1121321 RepID=A0A1M5PAQ3_9FIRM|nr:hypothetical protein [Asaccharospora irregularis]SHG98850.1 hypothetical protein SAMN04488530_11364 [Asaccharospora irregularis DSM 2635]
MAKLEDTLSRFLGGDDGLFGNKMLVVIVIVFLLLCTDILEVFLEDENAWVWVILVILLLFNFDDCCC